MDTSLLPEHYRAFIPVKLSIPSWILLAEGDPLPVQEYLSQFLHGYFEKEQKKTIWDQIVDSQFLHGYFCPSSSHCRRRLLRLSIPSWILLMSRSVLRIAELASLNSFMDTSPTLTP